MSMLPHDTGLRVAAPSNSVPDMGRSGCLRDLPSHVGARSVGFVHATRSHNPPGTEVQECREKMSERPRTSNVDLSLIFFVVSDLHHSALEVQPDLLLLDGHGQLHLVSLNVSRRLALTLAVMRELPACCATSSC